MSEQKEMLVFDPVTGGHVKMKPVTQLRPEARRQFEREDELSRLPDHPNHCFPIIPKGARVLAIGDGGGWKGQADGMELFHASDPDPEAPVWRKEQNPDDPCIIGYGEDLSAYKDADYTFLYSRGAVMFMDIPKFMAEAARVTRPGATMWIMYHSWRKTVRHMFHSLGHGRIKDVIYRMYVLANGLLFHFTGKLMHFPIRKDRMESFQTKHAIRRELERAGFTNVVFHPREGGKISDYFTAVRR